MKLFYFLNLIFIIAFISEIKSIQEIDSTFEPIRDTRFLVFTRFNPTIGQVVDLTNMNTVINSNYDVNRPTRFIIHGQFGSDQSELNILVTAAYLRSSDVNVIVVDWSVGADTINYVAARNRVRPVGAVVATFIDNLHAANLIDFSRIVIVSHSLGGHVGGFVGKNVRRGRINTIFGLNPAGPLFDVNNPADRLDSTDAEYVEVIHTESGTFGIGTPIGHANFYINGGTNQPGCFTNTCDHNRSFELFAESLNSNQLLGRQCSNIDEMNRNECNGPVHSLGGEPTNAQINLRGIFRLATASSSPFGLGPPV
ncbi:CLUMA_CG004689, isoform A [Clunio marinus]|uniref:CLUMA_CG004689, isoform A n=1 Tax=Clunio marinus TaxID=568069 RepID=A0A1J1HXX8_9DIPT|nr:CLUMA_CG004689, isoform A [Clunio marinus]